MNRVVLILCVALMMILGGCGKQTPRFVVQEALQWQIEHPQGQRQQLVGSDQLAPWVKLHSVTVKKDRSIPIKTGAQSFSGHQIQGHYNLTLTQGRRPYPTTKEPFQIVLVERQDPAQWLLAVPEQSGWQLVALGIPVVASPSPLPTLAPSAAPTAPTPTA